MIQNGSGICTGRNRKCNTAWNIGLDNTSDNINARTLCSYNQMNTSCTGKLCNTLNRLFHIFSGN